MKKYILLTGLILVLLLALSTGCIVSKNNESHTGYIVAGNISGSIGGQTLIKGNAVLIKLNNTGEILWDCELTDGSQVYSVERTIDGGFVAVGEINGGNLFLAKVNNSGKVIWEKNYKGGSYVRGRSVQETDDGGYIVSGEIDSFDGKSWQIWLTKLNSKGDMQWDKTYGSGIASAALQVEKGFIVACSVVTNNSNYGSEPYLIKTDKNGAIVWEKTFAPQGFDAFRSIKQTPDNGYVLAGIKAANSISSDVWIIKLDRDGNKIWDKGFSYSDSDSGYSLEFTQDGGFIVITNKGRIIKTDSNGEILWQNIAYGALDTKDNESVGICPNSQRDQGYLVSLEKSVHKMPLHGTTGMPIMSPLLSQQLLLTLFNINGEQIQQTSYDLPIKQ